MGGGVGLGEEVFYALFHGVGAGLGGRGGEGGFRLLLLSASEGGGHRVCWCWKVKVARVYV